MKYLSEELWKKPEIKGWCCEEVEVKLAQNHSSIDSTEALS
jgi:hypothetical protein